MMALASNAERVVPWCCHVLPHTAIGLAAAAAGPFVVKKCLSVVITVDLDLMLWGYTYLPSLLSHAGGNVLQ